MKVYRWSLLVAALVLAGLLGAETPRHRRRPVEVRPNESVAGRREVVDRNSRSREAVVDRSLPSRDVVADRNSLRREAQAGEAGTREYRLEDGRRAESYYPGHINELKPQARLHEMEVRQDLRKDGYQVHEKVYLRTQEGTTTVADLVVREKDGTYKVVEAKATAGEQKEFQKDRRLTPNQRKAFTEITERNSSVEVRSKESGVASQGERITVSKIEVRGEKK